MRCTRHCQCFFDVELEIVRQYITRWPGGRAPTTLDMLRILLNPPRQTADGEEAMQ